MQQAFDFIPPYAHPIDRYRSQNGQGERYTASLSREIRHKFGGKHITDRIHPWSNIGNKNLDISAIGALQIGDGPVNISAKEQRKIDRRRGLIDRIQPANRNLINHDGLQTAPIFTESIRALADSSNKSGQKTFSQFGLLAGYSNSAPNDANFEMFHYNVAAPSSTFICGSQGSGKSHTLSCLLENCLFKSDANELPRPLTGLLFHYDSFTSDNKGSPCEAAFLASNESVKVRVLCAPTNLRFIKQTYQGLPVQVEPLRIREQDLNTKRMKDLMAISSEDKMPLYMHVVNRILKEMRMEQNASGAGFSFKTFMNKLSKADLMRDQRVPLDQRLENLKSFMAMNNEKGTNWTPRAGQLTIVDLSCPCVTPAGAAQLFNICLSLFLEKDKTIGRVVALDEAHKYMGDSAEASVLTEQLLCTIRLQRHLAARIIISTQEPTVSPKLLDLCSATIVHRFTSPDWLRVLQKHLAGVSDDTRTVGRIMDGSPAGSAPAQSDQSLLRHIVQLRVGEALVFAPSAILAFNEGHLVKGNDVVLKLRVRKRVTRDGGKSIMAA